MTAGPNIHNMDIRELNQQKRRSGTVGASGQKPVDKRLGRGIEDVSHLFLSSRTVAGGTDRVASVNPAPESHACPADHLIPTTSDLSLALNRDQLAALLKSNVAFLEDGMRAIDINLACEIGGAIGLLAIDRTNRLTIIDFEAALNDSLLMTGIAHFDWLVRNIPLLKRVYGVHGIDFASQPRVFLVAPRFSEVLRRVASRIVYPQIACFRYHTATIPEGTSVFFERVK